MNNESLSMNKSLGAILCVHSQEETLPSSVISHCTFISLRDVQEAG